MVQSRELVTEHIWSQVNLYCFGLPYVFYEGLHKFSANGHNKWKRLNIELTNGEPPRAVYLCQDKGWMSNEGFVTWLRHFIDFVKSKMEETIALILDKRATHTRNLAAVEMAQEARVVMVSLPPNTTHRLQPLDVAFFGPFGKYYDDALKIWMREHVGRPVTTWQVAEILYEAYRKATPIKNAVIGFRKAVL